MTPAAGDECGGVHTDDYDDDDVEDCVVVGVSSSWAKASLRLTMTAFLLNARWRFECWRLAVSNAEAKRNACSRMDGPVAAVVVAVAVAAVATDAFAGVRDAAAVAHGMVCYCWC